MRITVNLHVSEGVGKLLERIAAALERIADNTKPEPAEPADLKIEVKSTDSPAT